MASASASDSVYNEALQSLPHWLSYLEQQKRRYQEQLDRMKTPAEEQALVGEATPLKQADFLEEL